MVWSFSHVKSRTCFEFLSTIAFDDDCAGRSPAAFDIGDIGGMLEELLFVGKAHHNEGVDELEHNDDMDKVYVLDVNFLRHALTSLGPDCDIAVAVETGECMP